ncbi:MAG: tetratricopeptide repeat protein, partial [Chlorobiaceae bacterium]
MKNVCRFLIIAGIVLPLTTSAASARAVDDAKSYYSSAEEKFGSGDYQGAIADDNKAIELDPSYAEAYTGRAAAKFRMGDKPGAIADYTRAIELDPKSAEALN